MKFLEPYRRITSSGRFIPEIDGLRFVAILFVFLYHLSGDVLRHSAPGYAQSLQPDPLFQVTQILNLGVPLFFVISGFILSLPFAESYRGRKKPVSLKKYFWRRLTRLEPPYILCLLILYILKIAANKGSAASLLPNLIASVFCVHNPAFGRPSDIDFVAWSLEVEVQFYILAPLLASVFGIASALIRRWLLVAFVLLTTAINTIFSGHRLLQLSLAGHIQYFLIGFLLAELFLSGGDRRQEDWRWDVVSLAGWPLLLYLCVRGESIALLAIPWLVFLLYASAYHGVVINTLLTNA